MGMDTIKTLILQKGGETMGKGERGKGRWRLMCNLDIAGIIIGIKNYGDGEAEEDAQNNADSAAAPNNIVEAAFTNEEVVKILTDKRLQIKQLKGKHGELRSLILGLVISSLILCSLTILWITTRGQQLDRKLKNLELNVETSEESMEKVKKEITEQLIKEFSHSENDENAAVKLKVIDEDKFNFESPQNNDLYNPPPTNIISTFHIMGEARTFTLEDVAITEARKRTGSGLVVADIE